MDTGTLGNCLMMCSKASFSWSFPHAVMVLQRMAELLNIHLKKSKTGKTEHSDRVIMSQSVQKRALHSRF